MFKMCVTAKERINNCHSVLAWLRRPAGEKSTFALRRDAGATIGAQILTPVTYCYRFTGDLLPSGKST